MKESFFALMETLHGGINNISSRFLAGAVGPKDQGCPELLQAVAQAHREWEMAKRIFESVTDPDLVDYAIYQVQAAQKHYTYLLRRAKEEGLGPQERV